MAGADKACASRANRDRPPAFDPEIHKQHHTVECGINRAVATRFDQLAVRHEATIHIAAINERL